MAVPMQKFPLPSRIFGVLVTTVIPPCALLTQAVYRRAVKKWKCLTSADKVHSMANSMSKISITGLILAGGRGSRMGSVDKGLQPFRGEPMVAHVIARLSPQVGNLIINANQH